MELFDNQIRELYEILQMDNPKRCVKKSCGSIQTNRTIQKKEKLILKSDMAFELGGGFHQAVTDMITTTSRELVDDSEVVLIGSDLKDISEDTDYARIVLVRFRDEYIQSLNETDFYRQLRTLSYLRYKMYIDGFMTRISSTKEREPIRVSKYAREQEMSLFEVGKLFADKYLECEGVEAVKVIFITGEQPFYPKLKEIADKCEDITDSIDHILSGMIMDCSTCNLKEVCDEVEELRDIHKKMSGR